jgi:uncharacterized membrane protein YfcA
MEFLSHINFLYVASGIAVGTLVGFTGVGGGSLMTPILILLFGVHPASAVGTDLLYAAATKTAGTAVHGFNKTIDWKVVGWLALGSIPMTALTVLMLYWLGVDNKATQAIITKVLGLALLITAISLFARDKLMQLYGKRINALDAALVGPLTVLTGAILGVLVTISSVGAGAIGVTALVFLYPKMPAQRIVGSDIAHAVPLTLIAGLGHSVLGTIDLQILGSLLLGSIPAIVIASMLAVRVPEKAIRIALGVVLLAVCARFWLM